MSVTAKVGRLPCHKTVVCRFRFPQMRRRLSTYTGIYSRRDMSRRALWPYLQRGADRGGYSHSTGDRAPSPPAAPRLRPSRPATRTVTGLPPHRRPTYSVLTQIVALQSNVDPKRRRWMLGATPTSKNFYEINKKLRFHFLIRFSCNSKQTFFNKQKSLVLFL